MPEKAGVVAVGIVYLLPEFLSVEIELDRD